MANEKKTEYVVMVRKVVQLIADPEAPDQYAEHEAFIPVRGLGSGKPPMPANSGPEACRLYAREHPPEDGDESLVLRAVSVRNWSGTDAGLELQMTFKDVLPPPRGSSESEREPEHEPPASEPEPAAA